MAADTRTLHLTGDESIEALLLASSDPGLSQKNIKLLCNHSNESVRRAILRHPKLGAGPSRFGLSLLERLAKEFPEEVATQNPSFCLHVLIDPSPHMRWVAKAVASNTTNVELIRSLLATFDPVDSLQQEVLSNPHTPASILEWILDLDSKSWTNLSTLARNTACPAHLFERLYRFSGACCDIVRMSLALNPSLPLDIMRKLGDQKTEPDNNIRANVSRNVACAEDVLWILGCAATESCEEIRSQVALNPRAPRELLEHMADAEREPEQSVRNTALQRLQPVGSVVF